MQQIASPRELYEQPVNLFVAGFIGSPPMNFLPARVEDRSLRLPFCEVPFGEEFADKVKGKDLVIVGLRPEFVKDAEIRTRCRGRRVRGRRRRHGVAGQRAVCVHPLRVRRAVRAKLDELDRDLDGEGMRTQMVVNLEARSRVREGERARFFFDPKLMHVFDPENGDNLTRNEEEAKRIAAESEEDRKRALERAKRKEAEAPA